ncbi:MAG: dephospho-CoA kinase [Comamonadaceae bacterium]|nr:dephospho-CoA kinase [Comamonadaceae bacterium]
MRILRFLVLLLVVANLLLFAAEAGLFGGSGSGEPERLTNQLNPEKIRILQSGSATAPSAAAILAAAAQAGSGAQPESKVDRRIGGVRPVAASPRCRGSGRAASPTWRAPGRGRIEAVQKSLEEPSSYWVHIAPQPGRQELDSRIAELKAAGISDYFIEQKAGPNHLCGVARPVQDRAHGPRPARQAEGQRHIRGAHRGARKARPGGCRSNFAARRRTSTRCWPTSSRRFPASKRSSAKRHGNGSCDMVVGITGGIGSGKSAVGDSCSPSCGAPVVDTDAIAHELTASGGAAMPSDPQRLRQAR